MSSQVNFSQSARAAVEPIISLEPSRALLNLGLGEVWQHRELLYFLARREIKVRYKQTLIGAAWVVFPPLMTIIIFTVVFDHFVKVPSDGLPYPILAFAGPLPWSYFS